MRFIKNPDKERELLENCISKYGYVPDHNFDWLMYCADEGEPRAAVWDEEYLVWCYQNKNEWIVVSDPIVPKGKQGEILGELAANIFSAGASKIRFLDLREGPRHIVRSLHPDGYGFDYEIVWPVVDMNLFDPKLAGGHLKSIRNALNKFNREHSVKITPTDGVDKKDLHGIVERWLDNRTRAGIEELVPKRYHNMIDGNFRGTKSARVMVVNGQPVGFNAGWETPNADKEWAAAIGIHDFSVKDLGISLLVEDLEWIKSAGYKTCDLEGSDPEPLKFKIQFFPNGYSSYKTYTFQIDK